MSLKLLIKLASISLLSYFVLVSNDSYGDASNDSLEELIQEENLQDSGSKPEKEDYSDIVQDHSDSHSSQSKIPIWLVLPFILLLLMIATGPLFYEKFWHKNYYKIAIGLALGVSSYYIFIQKDILTPVESFSEYIQFISLISALYIASGGIYISINRASTPSANLLLLLIGAVASNLIGTTGASMLLIRPYIRMNRGRIKVYHIVFFIFMVSNLGGALTPIGDPPLFLGFLKGVPFFWTLVHNFLPWITAITALGIVFFIIDTKNHKIKPNVIEEKGKGKIIIEGKKKFILLLLMIISVFIDPNIYSFIPSIPFYGHKISFIRELILLFIGYFTLVFSNKEILKKNEFDLEPLKEVIFIFIGIFGTMAPAMSIVSTISKSEIGMALINKSSLYWGSGILSSFLDNAPTYVNFLTASMGAQGADISDSKDVISYAMGAKYAGSVIRLKSISIASVFFGAMTYIGNGPNFMVKSISEQNNIKMPSFFGYIFKYSIIILLPILFMIWLIFFYLL